MSIKEVSKQLAADFSVRNLIRFLREKGFQTKGDGTLATRHWTAKEKETCHLDDLYAKFSEPGLAGYTTFQATQTSFPVFFVELKEGTLAERSSRKLQFDYAKQILLFVSGTREYGLPSPCEHGIFVFSDNSRHVRMSLIEGIGKADSQKRFRRYTFYVDPEATNRTFIERMSMKWDSFAEIKEAFSVERLSDDFFKAYTEKHYQDFVAYATGIRMGYKNKKWVVIEQKAPNKEIMDQFADFDDPEKALRDYVKKMMGRLVFLQFLAKKGWLGVPEGQAWGKGDRKYLQNLFNSKSKEIQNDFLEKVLEPLFFQTLNTDRTADKDLAVDILSLDGNKIRIPYLNGGLFEKDALDETTVKFPAKYFNDLFETFERFNFTIDENGPEDAEIGVDPEMLGRIFENLLEDNKDKGAFYTPKEIVNYMCQESLIQYLGDTPENRKLVTELDAEAIPPDQKKPLIEKLKAVKICDPAIGSGAFPMGMLNLLLHLRIKLGDVNDSTEGMLKAKKEIIQNNIYGVDIEPGAVDIARLRFWLSIVVDEDTPTPLPNFDYKIMQGNSLLEQYHGVDLKLDLRPTDKKGKQINTSLIDRQMRFAWDDEVNALEKLKVAMADFFEPEPGADKIALRNNIDLAVKNYIKTKCGNDPQVNADIDALDLNDKPFFLWHLYFADVFAQGGFDIVIGNPPYIDSETMTNVMPEQRQILRKNYPNLVGNWDIYMAFWEQANCLSKNVFAYITPDKWLSKPFGMNFRKNIMTKKMSSIILCGKDIFENATVDAIISIFRTRARETMFGRFSSEKNPIILATSALANLKSPFYIDCFFSSALPILKKIERNSRNTLAALGVCEGACATSDAYALEPLLIDSAIFDAKKQYKLVNTGTISKFASRWGIQPITYLGHHVLNPVVMKEDFQRNFGQTYLRRAASPKIIMKGLNLLDAFLDENAEYIPGKTTLCVCSENVENLKFLLSILNSTVVFFYIKIKVSSSSYCGGITFTPEIINSLPLPQVSTEEKNTLIHYSDEMLNGDIGFSEGMAQINKYVSRLYRLDDAEFECINDFFKKTKKTEKKKTEDSLQPKSKVQLDENDGDDSRS